MKTEFPSRVAVGCLFQWKQAIRRKLVDFHIPKDLISELIDTNGVMNILTAIPTRKSYLRGSHTADAASMSLDTRISSMHSGTISLEHG